MSLNKGIITGTLDKARIEPILHQLRVGNYYSSTLRAYYFNVTQLNFGADSFIAHPFYVTRRMRFDRIGFHIAGVGAAGALARIGIYYDDGLLYPGTLLLDAGAIDATAAVLREVTINVTLEPGIFWLAWVLNDATIDVYRTTYYLSILGGASPNINRGSWLVAYAYGALPNPFPAGAVADENIWPSIGLRLAELL